MKKSQGEIFGVAMMFVIILIGFLIYAKYKAALPKDQEEDIRYLKYESLASSTIAAVLQESTGCFVERNRDSVKDLLRYCLINGYVGSDPTINCNIDDHIKTKYACSYTEEIIGKALDYFFTEGNIGTLPYNLTIEVPSNPYSLMHKVEITNIGSLNITYGGKNITINETNLYEYFPNRASGEKYVLESPQGAIEFYFYIYYR